jgi:hypothetical protein
MAADRDLGLKGAQDKPLLVEIELIEVPQRPGRILVKCHHRAHVGPVSPDLSGGQDHR